MRLLIVDDHSILREGVAEILHQAGPDTETIQAGSISDALALVHARPELDAIVLDISMPGESGLSAIAEFHAVTPAPVIILSSSEDPMIVRQAIALGARGYVAKSSGAETLLTALRTVLSGEVHMPSFMDEMTIVPGTRGVLTQRQMEVLEAICDGLSNKDIGQKLDLSEKTVKVHVTAIFRALNVVNRTQAVNAARAVKLVGDARRAGAKAVG